MPHTPTTAFPSTQGLTSTSQESPWTLLPLIAQSEFPSKSWTPPPPKQIRTQHLSPSLHCAPVSHHQPLNYPPCSFLDPLIGHPPPSTHTILIKRNQIMSCNVFRPLRTRFFVIRFLPLWPPHAHSAFTHTSSYTVCFLSLNHDRSAPLSWPLQLLFLLLGLFFPHPLIFPPPCHPTLQFQLKCHQTQPGISWK